MTIHEYKKDYWISAWTYADLKTKYGTTYGHNENYYDDRVSKARRKFVEDNAILSECFDYGCGKNPFYDKSEIGGRWDKYTEGCTSFSKEKYFSCKTLLLFDVIEHIYDPYSFLLTLPMKQVIITVPIIQGNKLHSLDEIMDWKHYKPGEHFWYWTEQGFEEYVKLAGWKILKKDYNECPPRVDICTFLLGN